MDIERRTAGEVSVGRILVGTVALTRGSRTV